MYGYEQAWWHIAQKYSTQIHVSKERYQLYCHLNPGMFQSILTTDESSTRFHSCSWKKNSSCIQHGDYTISVQGVPIVGNCIRPFTKNDYKLRSDLPKHAKVHQEMVCRQFFIDRQSTKKKTNLLYNIDFPIFNAFFIIGISGFYKTY